jgi:hypothetical protein
MRNIVSHLHLRDWRFLGFITLSLATMGLYLATGLAQLEQSGSGWRRIDTDAVRKLMDSGELSGREADWFHPTRPGEHPNQSTSR